MLDSIGKPLALFELRLFFEEVAKRFSLRTTPDSNVGARYQVTTVPNDDIFLEVYLQDAA